MKFHQTEQSVGEGIRLKSFAQQCAWWLLDGWWMDCAELSPQFLIFIVPVSGPHSSGWGQ